MEKNGNGMEWNGMEMEFSIMESITTLFAHYSTVDGVTDRTPQ